MLARMLAHFGYVVVEARNGKEGLAMFHSSNADLVITDIVMPEKEGFEVLMELKKVQPPVKIIAMSGGGRHSPTQILQIARHLGASTILAKPFSNGELVAAIRTLLTDAGTGTKASAAVD